MNFVKYVINDFRRLHQVLNKAGTHEFNDNFHPIQRLHF